MIRAILFDLDGTLFDRASSVERFIEDQHERLHEILEAIPRAAYVADFVRLDARGYVKKDEVYAQLSLEYGLAPGTADLLFSDFGLHYHEHAVLFGGVAELLTSLRLRGLRLGIVTNGSVSHQKATIEALQIAHFFDTILISEAEGVRKPDPAIFRRALSQLSVASAEAIFVGDHPEVDVRGARKAGLYGVWKCDPYFGECPWADAAIDHVTDLPGVIASIEASRPSKAIST